MPATSMPRRIAIAFAVTVLACTATVAPALASTPGSVHSDGALPPAERDQLARTFDPALSKLGLRTTRAALQNPDEYARSDKGTHLAIYVEPIDPKVVDDAFYVERITTAARVFLPTVFRRWPGLESFDVCLEPIEIPTPVPPPVSQLLVTRAGARAVKWKQADLADLLEAAAERSPDGKESGDRESFYLYVSPRLRDSPDYLGARDDAGLPPITTTTSTTRTTLAGA